jgi:flagellar protein FlgJ
MAISSTSSVSPRNVLAADVKSLDALKYQAGNDTPAAIKESAKQLESLFMRELIKSMRDATVKSGMLDSPAGDLGSDMLDQQLSLAMSGQPGGLSEAIERQLSRQVVRPDGTTVGGAGGKINLAPPLTNFKTPPTATQTSFVQQHNEVATKVEQASGIPASFMLGQAGHETGWGKSEIRKADGSSSFNLFGIKAGANWTGKTANVTTTEYINGEPRKVVAKFRAYDSYEESFKDYARLINENPRYAEARDKTSALAYATELKRAGYATDPQYASKLSRAIDRTEQLRRAYV